VGPQEFFAKRKLKERQTARVIWMGRGRPFRHQLKVGKNPTQGVESRESKTSDRLTPGSGEPATPLSAIRRTAILQRHDRQSFERKQRSICVIF
jgi:hypothetical protein